MLTLENLGKRYGYRQVFRGVDYSVESGQLVAVTGRNGAGKSTLLRIIAGLLRPSTGKVLLSTSQIGLSAPDAPLYRELTVEENLQFFARSQDYYHGKFNIEALLERFSLEPRRDDLAGDLSSGWRARLQLATAVLASPKVLLLDEPAANLDEPGHKLLWEILTEQRQHGIALVATNDSREAQLCDRCLSLSSAS